MKRVRSILAGTLWIVALALTFNAVRLIGERRNALRTAVGAPSTSTAPSIRLGPLHVAPYTVYLDPGGSGTASKVTRTLIYAQRSDGSHVRKYEALGGVSNVSSRQIVSADGRILVTNDVTEEWWITHAASDIRVRLRDAGTKCLTSLAGLPFADGQELVGAETLLGQETIRIRSAQKTVWVAPDLGCAQLRVRNVHPSGEVLEQHAIRLIPGEPAGELFEVPHRYRLTSPQPRTR